MHKEIVLPNHLSNIPVQNKPVHKFTMNLKCELTEKFHEIFLKYLMNFYSVKSYIDYGFTLYICNCRKLSIYWVFLSLALFL